MNNLLSKIELKIITRNKAPEEKLYTYKGTCKLSE